MKVFEKPKIIKYLKSRQLEVLYLKQKRRIEKGQYELVDLRKMKPKRPAKRSYVLDFKCTSLLDTFKRQVERNQIAV